MKKIRLQYRIAFGLLSVNFLDQPSFQIPRSSQRKEQPTTTSDYSYRLKINIKNNYSLSNTLMCWLNQYSTHFSTHIRNLDQNSTTNLKMNCSVCSLNFLLVFRLAILRTTIRNGLWIQGLVIYQQKNQRTRPTRMNQLKLWSLIKKLK